MSIGEKFERTMMAVSFAEAGEHDTALEIMGEQKCLREEKHVTPRPTLTAFDRIMMAVSFAEAGEHDTALEIMGEQKRLRKEERVTPRPRARLELRAPSARR
jgi:uncharacterized protein (DUF111 family)